jgi:hypothetical protein
VRALDIVVNNAGIAIAELTHVHEGSEAATRREPLRCFPGRGANAYKELMVIYLGVRVNAIVGFPSMTAVVAVEVRHNIVR